jgi:hypothetical protein
MRVLGPAATVMLACWAGGVRAGDSLDLAGAVDVRWVHATGENSYLNGGLGLLRFDPAHEDLRLGRAFVATSLRVTDILKVHAVVDVYGDHDRNPVDLSELWAELRPFPSGSIRWQARVGAFHMPVSLENRAAGWGDVYSLTPSAINTWIGEEFRTIGAEVGARWLGASSGYLGDIGVVAAVYAWNDPAGALIADRGFGLTDRPSTLFGGLGRPPVTFFHEIDRKPGYYSGVSWRHHDRLEIRALHYDNRADPGSSTQAGGTAWLTRFSSVGARFEPDAHWTFIAQHLDGLTYVGAGSGPDADEQFRMTYHAAFGLASVDWGSERVTVRFDRFGTHQSQGFYGAPADQAGHAWTLAVTHELGEDWEAVVEYIRTDSRFPPRADAGLTASLTDAQLQLALRYRFRLSR